jgi:hypothetical protein
MTSHAPSAVIDRDTSSGRSSGSTARDAAATDAAAGVANATRAELRSEVGVAGVALGLAPAHCHQSHPPTPSHKV